MILLDNSILVLQFNSTLGCLKLYILREKTQENMISVLLQFWSHMVRPILSKSHEWAAWV